MLQRPAIMPKLFKPILSELLWLFISLITTILIAIFIFGRSFLNVTTDIHLHDTVFVFSAPTIVLPLFLLVTFFIFSIKETRNKFSRTLPNFVILVSGLSSIVLIELVKKELIRLPIFNWTEYPPLSALGKTNPFITTITNIITVLQLMVIIALLYIAFRWGTQRKQRS